jgi:flagellar biosynthesis/type III secretory pathway chaperone
LRILGIGDQLAALDKEEKAAYDERHAQGRIADQKEKYAAEMPEWHDVPDQPLTPGELVAQSQAIMQRNAERANARRQAQKLIDLVAAKTTRRNELRRMLADAEKELAEAEAQLSAAEVFVSDDESTGEIEAKLTELEQINAKVRGNLDKRKAIEDAEKCRAEWNRLADILEKCRLRRLALLNGAALPLPGLSVDAGELTYSGKAWDCMSSSEQYRVAVAIVRKLRPECGFVLLDRLETMDTAQLAEFGRWLADQGLQAIATRVSRGGECSIIIEDGMAIEPAVAEDKEW